MKRRNHTANNNQDRRWKQQRNGVIANMLEGRTRAEINLNPLLRKLSGALDKRDDAKRNHHKRVLHGRDVIWELLAHDWEYKDSGKRDITSEFRARAGRAQLLMSSSSVAPPNYSSFSKDAEGILLTGIFSGQLDASDDQSPKKATICVPWDRDLSNKEVAAIEKATGFEFDEQGYIDDGEVFVLPSQQ